MEREKVLIRTDQKFTAEKNYVCQVLFEEILGIPFAIDFANNSQMQYVVVLPGNAQLIFRDEFFSLHEETKVYDSSNLPTRVSYGRNQFLVEEDLPEVFGNAQTSIHDNLITCELDIFASSFFMLSRWEERVPVKGDSHGRFPAQQSLAYKFGFISRPIVNEYAEMLWNMMKALGLNMKRSHREYQLVLSHDVDHFVFWTGSIKSQLRRTFDSLKYTGNLATTVKHFFNSKSNVKKDPFHLDWLLKLSEENGLQSQVNMMSSRRSLYDSGYDLSSAAFKRSIADVKARGHTVGFHPSYYTFNDQELWMEEKERLEDLVGATDSGRQHYLRFEVPATWQIWEAAKMKLDSSMGFAEYPGFRCGICHSYTVFDLDERKSLSVKELPLICMDVTFTSHLRVDGPSMFKILCDFEDLIMRYSGQFTLLWHNSSCYDPFWLEYVAAYSRFLGRGRG